MSSALSRSDCSNPSRTGPKNAEETVATSQPHSITPINEKSSCQKTGRKRPYGHDELQEDTKSAKSSRNRLSYRSRPTYDTRPDSHHQHRKRGWKRGRRGMGKEKSTGAAVDPSACVWGAIKHQMLKTYRNNKRKSSGPQPSRELKETSENGASKDSSCSINTRKVQTSGRGTRDASGVTGSHWTCSKNSTTGSSSSRVNFHQCSTGSEVKSDDVRRGTKISQNFPPNTDIIQPKPQQESILIKRRSSQSILTFSGVPSLLPKQNRSSLLRMESGREIRLRNELLSSSRNRSRLTTGKIPENWNTDFGIRNAFLVNSKQILNCNVS
ncbi:uncharacterized protein LOC142342596 isoform X2 [Convolutriloba macropyga]|uniref:uncharacterized protein LOC142342596 isoform X2 n=1 Tax=Convolutriloba macropyga TaxID=536237 RepID=UPI003F51E177